MRLPLAFLINSLFLFSVNAGAEGFALAPFLEKKEISKPVIFNVWATWCAPCVKEMPELEELAASGEYHVYAMSIDRKEGFAQKFWQRGGYEHIHLIHDASGKNFYSSYSGEAIPITFILDENLNVKGVERGIRMWAHPEMKEKINQHLK